MRLFQIFAVLKDQQLAIYSGLLLGFVLAGALLSGCSPKPSFSPGSKWLYADLLAFEAPSTNNPSSDLVAVYVRKAGVDRQIRLDLLEMDPLPSFDLYLALDTKAGGRNDLPFPVESQLAWDTLLVLPASEPTRAYQSGEPGSALAADPALIPRIVRYPWLDSLVVSWNANNLPLGRAGFSLQAFLVDPENGAVLDTIGPLRSTALPPGRAPLLLAFWNTFPTYTPAQALRRWDGAHTGPYGERHGLHLLLQAVQHSKVPVVLLDLKSPASLSALDYLGKLPQVRNLSAQGLLILPEALPGSPGYPYFPDGLPDWAWGQALADSRQAGQIFGLRTSRFLYTPVIPQAVQPGFPVIFTQLDEDQPTSWQGDTLIPVPEPGSDPQMDQNGLSLELKDELLRNAASTGQESQHVPLVILGGSLPDHPLGDPQAAEAVFNYIAAHPWIHPFSGAELLTLRPSTAVEGLTRPGEVPYSSLLGKLPQPDGLSDPASLAAWQAAKTLYEPLPPEPEQLAQLRALYSGQPGLLAAASQWAAAPAALQDCSADLDLDSQTECLLADSQTLAVIDPLGGRLVMLFARTSSGLHQLVAPVSQLVTGLSDPLEWDLQAGEAAESPDLQGAFADAQTPWHMYAAGQNPGEIRLASPDGQVQKRFQLTPTGLRVEIRSETPQSWKVPVGIDPWQRFQPGWADRYRPEELPDGYAWQLADGTHFELRASTGLAESAFTDSRPQLILAENPNFAYPPGHYLPFPLTILEASGQKDFSIEFSVVDE